MARVSTRQTKLYGRLLNHLLRPRTFRVNPLQVAFTVAVTILAFWAGTMTKHSNRTDGINALVPIPASFSDNALANYYVGRGLLAGNQLQPALKFLHKAVEQEPGRPEFSHWQGVAYWASGKPELEKESYSRALKDQPDYLPSLLNLGHNYLESGNYTAALENYQRALQIDPNTPDALYNSALVYQKLNDNKREIQAFERYLRSYRTGKWAERAVEHLQQHGDYNFRSYMIGKQRIVLRMSDLLQPNSPAQAQEIEELARSFSQTNGQALNLVIYHQNDIEEAKKIALNLQHQLMRQLGPGRKYPVRVSWFDAAETVPLTNETKGQLASSLLIFTSYTPIDNRRKST
jgi:tetratricopeptide (TPR) repeat protein